MGPGWASQREGLQQCLQGRPDTLRKGVGKHWAVYHKIGQENRMVKIQSLTAKEEGRWEPQMRCSLKPQENIRQGSGKWDKMPFLKQGVTDLDSL